MVNERIQKKKKIINVIRSIIKSFNIPKWYLLIL